MKAGVADDGLIGKKVLEEIQYWQVLLEFIMMEEEIPKHKSVAEFLDYATMIKVKREKANAQ